MLKFGRLGRKLCKPETLSRVCISFFLLNTFYKIEIKKDEEKKIKSNTIDNEMSLTTFSIILNIIKSNNVTFNVFIISISKTSASQTSVAIWSLGLRKHLKGNAS